MEKLLLHNKPNRKKIELTLTEEVRDKIEALNYEKQSRFYILQYIKNSNLEVEQSIMDTYIKDYVTFSVRFEYELDSIIRKNQKIQKDFYDPIIDFGKKLLTWYEEESNDC